MNRMSGTLIKLSSITALAMVAVAVTSTGFAPQRRQPPRSMIFRPRRRITP
jgi:hypothetical protein